MMNEDSGADYLKSWKLNEPIDGLGGIGQIIKIGPGTICFFKSCLK
jgi:hypothetical protein